MDDKVAFPLWQATKEGRNLHKVPGMWPAFEAHRAHPVRSVPSIAIRVWKRQRSSGSLSF